MHRASVLGAKDIGGGAGGALLIRRRGLSYLTLQRGLLLGSQDVPYVVWRCSSAGRVRRCDMVRRTSVGVRGDCVEARVVV